MKRQEIKVEVGKRLQNIRGNRDQRTFAQSVDSVQQTISKYERGEIPRSWLFLARLQEEEGVDLNTLLGPESGDGEERGGEGNGPRQDEEREQRVERVSETGHSWSGGNGKEQEEEEYERTHAHASNGR